MTIGTLHNQTTGTSIGDRIACADGSYTRIKGLLGRPGLAAGEGLWIRPSSGIHTFGMRFPIDVLGLDAHMCVTLLWPELPPWRLPLPRLRMRSAVELAAGQIEAHGIAIGHRLIFQANPHALRCQEQKYSAKFSNK